MILPNHLGDVVMATPALRALRAGHPGARILGVIRRPLQEVLRGLPHVDAWLAHEVYAASPPARLIRRIRVGRELRGNDAVVVLPNSMVSALLARLSGAPVRLGYARRGRSWLLSRAVPAPRRGRSFVPQAMERYYLALVSHLGCPDLGTHLELATEPEAERACERLLAERGREPRRPLVGLAPGAGYGPSKLWPTRHYAALARALVGDGAQVALVHGPGEEDLADRIEAQAGVPLCRLGGDALSLSLLKSVVSRLSLLVCNDAGARHVAAAFGVRTLVLMGPTSIQFTNLNLERTRVLREDVPCAPCQLKRCPIDHRCMTQLAPERVIAQARAALADKDWQGSVDLEPGAAESGGTTS